MALLRFEPDQQLVRRRRDHLFGGRHGPGLSGTVVLQDNGGNDLSVSTSGPFTFSTGLTTGSPYNVTVKTNPAVETCSVANGSGTVGSANVTNVAVTCSAATTYSVGGTVSGLSGTVVLQDNGGNDLSVSTSGAFTFSTGLTTGSPYNVTVKTKPGGSDLLGGQRVRHRRVRERHQRRRHLLGGSARHYSVGGTVSGLSGTVVLQDNGGDDLSVSTSGAFTFTPV